MNSFPTRVTLLLLFLINSFVLMAQPRRLPTKNKPTLTLTNPASGIKVTFHDPAFTDSPLRKSAWKKLTVLTPDSTYTLSVGSMRGYMINPDFSNFWSPDGNYIALYYLYNIVSKDNYTRQVLTFIDLNYGSTVEFTTRSGDSLMSLGTFDTWVNGKPHSILTSTGEEANPD